MAARILIVEDEASLAKGIQFNFEIEGYETAVVADGAEALKRLTERGPGSEGFDLIILDVMLPGMDGYAVAERLREAGDFTPILMLTAKGRPEDMVRGLEGGADDYLAKPFDLPVLLARVKGLLRRRDWARGDAAEAADAAEAGLQTARVGEAEVDFRRFEVRNPGGTFRLTLLETMLLKLLVQNAGRVVSKGEILEKVWNVSPDTATRAVDNFIVRLRKYVEPDPASPKHLHTVRGAGYRLEL
jgi:DNA-binding response OmpR family regulator